MRAIYPPANFYSVRELIKLGVLRIADGGGEKERMKVMVFHMNDIR